MYVGVSVRAVQLTATWHLVGVQFMLINMEEGMEGN